MQLRPYQLDAADAVLREFGQVPSTLVVMPTGCHDPDQQILLWDGRRKRARDIREGERLMGPDGEPRTVFRVHTGTAEMRRVVPEKGDPFVVTWDHVLTLVCTRDASEPRCSCAGRAGELVDVSVDEWLRWPTSRQRLHKLVRVPHMRQVPRRQRQDALRTGFAVTPVGHGAYAGFTVDGDNRYLLGDFTVTHNCGKTIVFSEIIRRVFPHRAMVLAHREELIFQAQDKISRTTGLSTGVEMADLRVEETGGLFGGPQVVISSIQTQCSGGDGGGRRSKFNPQHFGLVVVDECHHCPAAPVRHRLLGLKPLLRKQPVRTPG